MPLFVNNSNDVVLRRLRKADGSGAITDATLTAVIKVHEDCDPAETQIASISLSHEGEGDYRGSTTAQITDGVKYVTTITASNYTLEFIRVDVGRDRTLT